jgi:hypothetical protein
MIRTAYITRDEAKRLLRQAIIDVLVERGWDREGILITEDDPFGNGINGYNCEQGTIEAQLIGAQADGDVET